MYVRSCNGGGAAWVISRLTSALAQSCAEAHSFTVLGRKTRPYLMLHPPSAILRTADLPCGRKYAVCIAFDWSFANRKPSVVERVCSLHCVRLELCEPQTFRFGEGMQSASAERDFANR